MATLGYLLLALTMIWGALYATRRHAASRGRRAFVSLVIALCFAPSFLVGGHGFAIAPAWLAGLQQLTFEGGSKYAVWTLGVGPTLATAILCFVVSEAWVLLRAKPK